MRAESLKENKKTKKKHNTKYQKISPDNDI